MRARYRTICRLCTGQIGIGDQIAFIGSRAAHAACFMKEAALRRLQSAKVQALLTKYERAGFR